MGVDPDPAAPESDTVTWARFLEGVDEDVEPRRLEQRDGGGYQVFAVSEQTVYVVEANAAGEMEAQRAINVPSTGEAMDITEDGGYVFAGSADGDMHVLKTHAEGNSEWGLPPGGEGYGSSASVQQTRDGGYIIGGDCDVYVVGQMSLWKVDAEGALEWQRGYASSDGDPFSSGDIAYQTHDGGHMLTGSTGGDYVSAWLYMVKTDMAGEREWDYHFRKDIGHHRSYDGLETSDGGYVLVGNISNTEMANRTEAVAPLIVKVDAEGNSEWEQAIEREKTADELVTVQETAGGGFVLAGKSAVGAEQENSQAYLVKLSPDSAV